MALHVHGVARAPWLSLLVVTAAHTGGCGYVELPELRRAVLLPLQAQGALPASTAAAFSEVLLSELARVENLEVVAPSDVQAMLQVELA